MKILGCITLGLLLTLMIPMLPIYMASATSTTVAINPSVSFVTIGKTLSVDVNVTDVANLSSWQFTMYFLNGVLNCTNAAEGPFLQTGGGTFFGKSINNNYNSTYGSVVAYSTLLGNTTVNGGGVIATITFNASGVGDATLHLSDTELGDEKIPPQPITHTDVDGTVHVQDFTLNVSTIGNGSVGLNNTGPYYHYGEAVQLTGIPLAGWSFDHWSGDLTGSFNPATLVITGDASVTATFTQDQYTLSIATVGGGSVGKSPNQATYTWGTNVTLTASANIGWSFAGWSGDASGAINPTTVNMTGNKAVTATFTQNTYALTVNVVGSGSVGLNSSGPYQYGDAVLLTATPAADWVFQYWSGDLSGSANPATMVMIADFSVTAHFVQKPTLQMSPVGKTCRVYGENFAVALNISNAVNVEGLKFEIHYNTTLLDCTGVTWNAWGSGTVTVNEIGGIITGSTSGAALNGTQVLVTIKFQTTFHHIWKSSAGWVNDLADTIFLQWANVSYPTGRDLRYEKGGLNEINVGPDFAYTFSPIQGDIDNNGIVNIFDIRTVAFYYSQANPQYDLNGDNVIDVYDLVLIGTNFGYTYTP